MKEMERKELEWWMGRVAPQQTAPKPQERPSSSTGLHRGSRSSAWSLTTGDPNAGAVPKRWEQKTNCRVLRSKYSEIQTPPSRSIMVMVKNEINLKETEEAEEFCLDDVIH